MKTVCVLQNGCDIAEHNPLFREIRYGSYVIFDFLHENSPSTAIVFQYCQPPEGRVLLTAIRQINTEFSISFEFLPCKDGPPL
jgi:hypothetical protein